MRLGLLDNDPIVTNVLASFLAAKLASCEVVWGETNAGTAVKRCVDADAPDVLLTDMSMKGSSGLSVIYNVRKDSNCVAILCMTSYTIETFAYGAARAEAQGICPKASLQVLCQALNAVAHERVWCPLVSIHFETVSESYRRLRHGEFPPANPLSAQESAIMELLVKGNSMAAAAKILGIKPGTVRAHVSHIKDKVGAKNLSQAVIQWLSILK